MRTLLLTLTTCLLALPVQAKYSGGSGTAQDPYLIATAADLIALGATPPDYDKHFVLTTDIDLDPNLPGRKVFDKAVVIAPGTQTASWPHYQGTAFTGVFDGGGHTISHLTIKGKDDLGLFGQLGRWDAPAGEVKNLGVVDVNVAGSGTGVGGLAGMNYGALTECYSTGAVRGVGYVGGLVGGNGGSVAHCYSAASVAGTDSIGGIVGGNGGIVECCYSTGSVSGTGPFVGGLRGAGQHGHQLILEHANQRSNNQCHRQGQNHGADAAGFELSWLELLRPNRLGD